MSSDMEAVIETATLAALPKQLEPGCKYIVHTREGVREFDTRGDLPPFKTGHPVFRDADGFCAYYGKHADEGSEVYADFDAGSVEAVLDAHGGTPRWRGHVATLQLQRTPSWLSWIRHDREMMSQQAFADFIEDNQADVTGEDSPVSVMDLLEIAQSLRIHTKVAYQSGTRTANGQTELAWVEESSASAGKHGKLTVPDIFIVALQPFWGTPRYRMAARLRYRVDPHSKALSFGYRLDGPDRASRDAVAEVVAQVGAETQATVMTGSPGLG